MNAFKLGKKGSCTEKKQYDGLLQKNTKYWTMNGNDTVDIDMSNCSWSYLKEAQTKKCKGELTKGAPKCHFISADANKTKWRGVEQSQSGCSKDTVLSFAK